MKGPIAAPAAIPAAHAPRGGVGLSLGFSVALALALAAGCRPPAGPADPGGSGPADPGGKGDVYGSDDRREVFDASELNRRLAAATAVLVPTSALYVDAQQRLRLVGTTWSERVALTMGVPLCATEPFREQPAPGGCSAFLIAPDLVATAGHCVNFTTPCADQRVVFGFAYEQSTAEADVTLVAPDDFYRCAGVVGHLFNRGAQSVEEVVAQAYWSDWAVIRLDRPVVGRTPLAVRPSGRIADASAVTAIGHPGGLPTKVTRGRIVDNQPELYFNTDLDIYGGNSGSVVVGGDGLVEGIAIRGTGGASFVRAGACARSRACTGWDPEAPGCTGNHVLRPAPLRQFTEAARMVTVAATPAGAAATIPDGAGACATELTVADPGPVRFATLTVEIAHWAPADLRLSLERGGVRAVLFERPQLQRAGYPTFSATTNLFDGGAAAGPWRVVVEDLTPSGGSPGTVAFVELVVGIGAAVAPEPGATFVGSPCQADGDCGFAAEATCWGVAAGGGFCTLPCAGTCPDRAGFAPTFCASRDGGASGTCVPQAHALNAACAALPGTAAVTAPRYVGASGAAAATAPVCWPAGV